MRAPAGGCEDEVTCRIRGMVGGEHLRHRFTRHDLAERERRRVGLPVIHKEAHVGVERQVLHPKEQLPGSRGRERGVFQAEVGHVRRALRARGEDDVTCHRERHIDTSTQMLRAGCPRRLPKSHRAQRSAQASSVLDTSIHPWKTCGMLTWAAIAHHAPLRCSHAPVPPAYAPCNVALVHGACLAAPWVLERQSWPCTRCPQPWTG